jgi:hypothetical protein
MVPSALLVVPSLRAKLLAPTAGYPMRGLWAPFGYLGLLSVEKKPNTAPSAPINRKNPSRCNSVLKVKGPSWGISPVLKRGNQSAAAIAAPLQRPMTRTAPRIAAMTASRKRCGCICFTRPFATLYANLPRLLSDGHHSASSCGSSAARSARICAHAHPAGFEECSCRPTAACIARHLHWARRSLSSSAYCDSQIP